MIDVETDILLDYMGEKARALGSRLKKHQTRTSSAVHKHCSTSGHSIIPDALRSYQPVPGSKIVGKAAREKLRQNCLGAGERQGSGACRHCFQYLITVYQLLVYPVIGQFRQLTSTLTLITWVHVKNMVSVQNPPAPDAFSLFMIKNL